MKRYILLPVAFMLLSAPIVVSADNVEVDSDAVENVQKHVQRVTVRKIHYSDDNVVNIENVIGENGSKFTVYDISELYKKMEADGPVDLVELKKRALNLSHDQLVVYHTGETTTVNGQDGVFQFDVDYVYGFAGAYLIKNEPSGDANISEPMVIALPLTDNQGVRLDNIDMYAKTVVHKPDKPVTKPKPITPPGDTSGDNDIVKPDESAGLSKVPTSNVSVPSKPLKLKQTGVKLSMWDRVRHVLLRMI